MAHLAIKGHATRGSEVIKLLEMLGGTCNQQLLGNSKKSCYFINNCGIIDQADSDYVSDDVFIIFTLEDFLEKYPYKVGDKVKVCGDNIGVITGMKWESDYVVYNIKLDKNEYETSKTVENLQPYIEEKEVEKKINQMSLAHCDLDEVEIVLGDKFEMVSKAGKWYAIRKKPQYPKTLEECCKVLLLNPEKSIYGLSGLEYKRHVIVELQRLLICRDAYWKAGDWKPGRTIMEQKYYIHSIPLYLKNLLPFPTEEMRDAFYENFKELIERCQELL